MLLFVGYNKLKATSAQHHILCSHLFNGEFVFAFAQHSATKLVGIVHAKGYHYLLSHLRRNDVGFNL